MERFCGRKSVDIDGAYPGRYGSQAGGDAGGKRRRLLNFWKIIQQMIDIKGGNRGVQLSPCTAWRNGESNVMSELAGRKPSRAQLTFVEFLCRQRRGP